MRLLILVVFLAIPLAAHAKRAALVIGNADYQSETPLKNAHADAVGLAETLVRLNFEVMHRTDLDRARFGETLRDFEKMMEGADVAAFYYAGHGIQFEGRNYLLPTDAELRNHFMFSAETMPLDAIVEAMTRSSATSLIFVDACRDNPYVNRLRSSLPATRSAEASRGLARLSSRPSEAIVVYATQPDDVALDGEGRNSPFATALMSHLPTPDAEIGLVMRRVIGEVRRTTDGRQSPEVTVSLTGELYLSDARTEPFQRPAEPAEERVDEPDVTRPAQEPGESSANRMLLDEGSLDQIELNLALNSSDLVSIQRSLQALGYSPGQADGIFGPRSRNALKEYQRAEGLAITGYLTASTVARLTSAAVGARSRDTNSQSSRSEPTLGDYDGAYELIVRRRWDDEYAKYHHDPYYKPGRQEVLAVVRFSRRGNSDLVLTSQRDFTGTMPDGFRGFNASLTNDGVMKFAVTISSHFGDRTLRKVSFSRKLPAISPGQSVRFETGRFDQKFFHNVELLRLK